MTTGVPAAGFTDRPPCPRCNQVHIAGNTCHRTNGDPCGKAPVRGMTICATHGGQAPQAKAARDRREAEQKLEQEIVRAATTGPLPLLEPGTTLLEAVAMLAQGVGYLRGKLANDDKPDPKDLDVFFGHVERLGRLAKLADDARLGERRQAHQERLDQVYGLQLTTFIGALVDRLDGLVRQRLTLPSTVVVLDPLDPEVRELVREELAAIEAGEVTG